MTQPSGMVDLETLGLSQSGAPIMQMAIATFHPRKPGIISSWSVRITLESNQDLGREVEPETEKWWQKPELADLWAQLKNNPSAIPLLDALLGLANFIKANDVGDIWANGPAFDIAMLECAYRGFDLDIPWSHRNARCTRTIWALAAEKHPPFALDSKMISEKLGWMAPEEKQTAHDALGDCIWQILKVQTAYAILDMDRADLKMLG